MTKKTRYTVEDKLRIINRNLIDGVGQNRIAAEEGIARSSVNLWVKQYIQDGKDALKNQPPYQHPRLDKSSLSALEIENAELRIENYRLKKGYMVDENGKFILLKKKNI